MREPKGFSSLKKFLESIQSAKPKAYLARPGAKVANEDAFADMQKHILSLYEKTEALHSFRDESGAIYDCIPVEQQPSLRRAPSRIHAPPEFPELEPVKGRKSRRQATFIGSPLEPDKKDCFGNVMRCPQGTIPMRRLTLEDLTRFATLSDFFQKGPAEKGRPPKTDEPPKIGDKSHRYATGGQNVTNVGGRSILSLNNPSIGANQVFSLSQHWYVGGSGSNRQTVEIGWQVYPLKYNDSKPHLFTYWTADNYNKTGCYNLECTAFVQISPKVSSGMGYNPPYSVIGGVQYILGFAAYHVHNVWWLYYWWYGWHGIGYYPDSLFKGGALAGNASRIEYGGETVGTVIGVDAKGKEITTFPPMGSGRFAAEGWGKAAFHKDVVYFYPAPDGKANYAAIAKLTAYQPTPACYTAQVNKYAPDWNETLWFGGPGGNC